VKRLAGLVTALLLANAAHGYYYFVHYVVRDGVVIGAPEKFDVNKLVNKTVPFVINLDGLQKLTAGDNVTALVSQLRRAANTWNIPTSDLRLAYDGVVTGEFTPSGPAIEIVFADLPPGLVALGGPTVVGDATSDLKTPFIPIARSIVMLNKDQSPRPGYTASSAASYGEAFFLTAVHEIGHTLGLQHTLTSSVMSTEVTRAATKAQPLAADDIAGISGLYPKAGFASSVGSISGRVTLGGGGVTLASVVALSPDGVSVSSLTQPDGSYTITGLVPASYYLYVHPLPPATQGETYPANIIPSRNVDGELTAAYTNFKPQFYPAASQFWDAQPIYMTAGETKQDFNFDVAGHSTPKLFGVTTYSFPGQIAVKPGTLSTVGGRNFVVATGYGLNSTARATVLGGSASVSGIKPYSAAYTQIDFNYGFVPGEGPRHLMFEQNGESYLLPSAFRLTKNAPPLIQTFEVDDAITSSSNVFKLSGARLSMNTTVLFDGVAGTVRSAAEDGTSLVVEIPPAPGLYRSTVVAMNNDGQSSLYLDAPLALTYQDRPASSVTLNTAELVAGSEGMLEITGVDTSFSADSALTFSTGEIVTRRVWALSPTRLLASVTVSPTVPESLLAPKVLSGLRAADSEPNALHVIAALPDQVRISGPITSLATGSEDVPAGSKAVVNVSNVLATTALNSIQITVSGIPATVVAAADGQVTFLVPLELPPGPAIVSVVAINVPAPRVVLSVDLPAPVIQSVESDKVIVKRLAEPGMDIAVARVKVTIGGVAHKPELITPGPDGTHTIEFIVDKTVPTGAQPLTVAVDGRPSEAVTIHIKSPNDPVAN
jgi:hypothetical protein